MTYTGHKKRGGNVRNQRTTHPMKTARRERAEERAESYRDPREQLAHLDRMFGKGNGAKKERARLARKIGGE